MVIHEFLHEKKYWILLLHLYILVEYNKIKKYSKLKTSTEIVEQSSSDAISTIEK